MLLFYRTLSLILFSFSISFTGAQSCFDEIKDKEIPMESFSRLEDSTVLNEFMANLSCFIGEDLDSIDLEILSEGPMLGLIFFDIASADEPITYGKVKQRMIDKTKGPRYPQMRELHILTREFSSLPAIYENWEKDKQALLGLGIPEAKLMPFENYLKTHSDPTKNYSELLNEFEQSKSTQTEVDEKEREKSMQDKFEDLLENKGAIALDSLCELSKSEQKPILLYFTGYAVVNSRRLEMNVLKDKEILKVLHDDFIFCAVYVDDKRALAEEEWKYSETLKRTTKTVGDVNLLAEIELCKIASQPYFVGLNAEQKVIGTGEYADFRYTTSFLTFLKSVELEFEK